jgi:hypothetical protein
VELVVLKVTIRLAVDEEPHNVAGIGCIAENVVCAKERVGVANHRVVLPHLEKLAHRDERRPRTRMNVNEPRRIMRVDSEAVGPEIVSHAAGDNLLLAQDEDVELVMNVKVAARVVFRIAAPVQHLSRLKLFQR